MCGIGGYVGRAAGEEVGAALLGALRHRGPDHEARLRLPAGDGGGAVAELCFARLAILDLSPAGQQPMATEDGALTIVYNGEAYNCQPLRAELQARGHRFRSGTDTEVVLRGFREWGPAVLDRLRGMYAFAIWDAGEQELTLCRDRIGIKPLYYCHHEATDRLGFASEVRALLAAGLCERRLDAAALHGFLTLGSVPEPRSLIAGVQMLPPGHLLRSRVRDGHIAPPTLRSYYTLPLPASMERLETRSAAAAAAPVLQEAVGLRLLADVPVGVLLSSGVDSTAVALLARRADPGGALHSFTLTYGADRAESEGALAQQLAETLSLQHHESLESEASLQVRVSDYLAAVDQPSVDGFNTFLVCQVVRAAGLKVALSGLGGDEAFLGYDLQRSFAVALALPALPEAVAQGLQRWPPQEAELDDALSLRRQKARDLLRAAAAPAAERPRALYAALRSLLPSGTVAALLDGDVVGALRPALSHIQDRLTPAQESRLAAPELLADLEIHNYLRNTLLRDADVMSMAHGVELRVPLCDHALLALVTALPAGSRRDPRWLGRRKKPLLLDACQSPLLDASAGRRKRGFVLPLADWLRGAALGEAVATLLSSAAAVQAVGLRPAAVTRLWQLFRRGQAPEATFRIWALYTLLAWARRHRLSL